MGVPQVLLGNSRATREIVAEAEAIAATDAKVLITGESGVGKELIARLIHERSRRAQRPIVSVNCGAISESLLESELFGHVRGSFTDAHRDRRGLLEVADGGTVLLDEVAEMSIRMQALLLRFLENGEIQRVGSERVQSVVDVRVIAATNRDLLEQSNRGGFRSDLYYRLNVVHFVVPPLRERPEDIKLLFDHYVGLASTTHRLQPCSIDADAMARLEAYQWPGNVREVRNIAERLVLRHAGRVVSVSNLPHPIAMSAGPVPAIVKAGATAHGLAGACYERMINGRESFWTVIYEPFKQHDMTRETVRAVVRRGLENTRGSYRLTAQLFNLPATDYKRFLNFLQKHDCHMPFGPFRAIAEESAFTPQRVQKATADLRVAG